MIILRLNDGKHFLQQHTESKVERVFGQINAEDQLVFFQNEVPIIRKIFEPLYANHLQFIGKVIEA